MQLIFTKFGPKIHLTFPAKFQINPVFPVFPVIPVFPARVATLSQKFQKIPKNPQKNLIIPRLSNLRNYKKLQKNPKKSQKFQKSFDLVHFFVTWKKKCFDNKSHTGFSLSFLMLHVAPKKNVATLQSTNQIAGLQMSLFSDGHVRRLIWNNILQGFDMVESIHRGDWRSGKCSSFCSQLSTKNL